MAIARCEVDRHFQVSHSSKVARCVKMMGGRDEESLFRSSSDRVGPPQLTWLQFGLKTYEPVVSGESHLQCFQRMRLHGLTPSDLELAALCEPVVM